MFQSGRSVLRIIVQQCAEVFEIAHSPDLVNKVRSECLQTERKPCS